MVKFVVSRHTAQPDKMLRCASSRFTTRSFSEFPKFMCRLPTCSNCYFFCTIAVNFSFTSSCTSTSLYLLHVVLHLPPRHSRNDQCQM